MKKEKGKQKDDITLHLIFQPNQATKIFILPPTPDTAMEERKQEP
jgi:hypothetical protein